MESPTTTENTTAIATEGTATSATEPVAEAKAEAEETAATPAEKPVKRAFPPETKALFTALKERVWDEDVPLTDIFRARSVEIEGVKQVLCSNDNGGGCAEEIEEEAKRPSLVLKGEDGFFLAPLCAKCAQAVSHFKYELKRRVANDEKHERCGDARRMLSHTRVCVGKADAEARLAEVSAPKADPRAVKDAAHADLVKYFRALRKEEHYTKGGEEFVRVRMSDEVTLPLASSKRPGAYFGKCVPTSPKSYFAAFAVVRYLDGWKVILLTSFELSALIKAGARDLVFNGWFYQPLNDEEVTEELIDRLFREAELRALELTQKGEEGVRKAERQARYEARGKAGGGNRGGGGGGGQGRETKVTPASAPQTAPSDPAPQADPIAIAADADKTRARERHATRKGRKGDSDGERAEFHQEMELEGSRRGRRGRNGQPQDDRDWAEHTSAGNGKATIGDKFGSVLAKVQVAPGPNQ